MPPAPTPYSNLARVYILNSTIERQENRITVVGDLYDFHRLLSDIHHTIERLGYQEVTIDFTACTSAFQNAMLSVCAQVLAYRQSGVEFAFVPPAKKEA